MDGGARTVELFDPDLVEQIVARSRELGITVQLGTQAEGIEKGSCCLTVKASAAGQNRTFEADMGVHAAGRTPEIDDMNLDGARVAWAETAANANDCLQTLPNPTL